MIFIAFFVCTEMNLIAFSGCNYVNMQYAALSGAML